MREWSGGCTSGIMTERARAILTLRADLVVPRRETRSFPTPRTRDFFSLKRWLRSPARSSIHSARTLTQTPDDHSLSSTPPLAAFHPPCPPTTAHSASCRLPLDLSYPRTPNATPFATSSTPNRALPTVKARLERLIPSKTPARKAPHTPVPLSTPSTPLGAQTTATRPPRTAPPFAHILQTRATGRARRRQHAPVPPQWAAELPPTSPTNPINPTSANAAFPSRPPPMPASEL